MTTSKNVKIEHYKEWTEVHRALVNVEEQTWTLSRIFCPSCGVRTLWEGPDDGDNWGPEYICVTCGASHHIPDPDGLADSEGLQVIKQLKEKS